MKIVDRIVSKEEVNTGRQIEFDIAKVFCIFGMVIIHSFLYLSNKCFDKGSLSYYVSMVWPTLFGAAAFMICMGTGFEYTRHKDEPTFFIKRGIKVFILGYILNLIRSTPIVFICNPVLNGSVDMFGLPLYLLNCDIFQFAGIAMICFGVFKKLKLKPGQMFLIAVIFSIISNFVPYESFGNRVIDLLAGLFIPNACYKSDTIYTCFPLINYLIYPMFGYIFSIFYKRVKDKGLFYKIIIPIALLVMIVYLTFAYRYHLSVLTPVGYYHVSLYNACFCILSCLFLFGVSYFVSKRLSDNAKSRAIFNSSCISIIYCVHWVILSIVCSTYYIINNWVIDLKEWQVVLIGLVIYFVSINISYRIKRREESKKRA